MYDYCDHDDDSSRAFTIGSVRLRGFVRADGRTLADTPVQVWVDALRSGEYQQCQQRLADGSGFCCLGVACDLALRAGIIDRYDPSDGSLEFYRPVRQFFGLAQVDGEYWSPDLGSYTTLIAANDTCGMNFVEIAEIIDSRPEGLFVK
jgi:hypothetical protein